MGATPPPPPTLASKLSVLSGRVEVEVEEGGVQLSRGEIWQVPSKRSRRRGDGLVLEPQIQRADRQTAEGSATG